MVKRPKPFIKVCRTKSEGNRVNPLHKAMNSIEAHNDEGAFVVSYVGRDSTGRRRTVMYTVKVEDTPVKALIDTEASVNIMDETILKRVRTRQKIMQTQAQIYT